MSYVKNIEITRRHLLNKLHRQLSAEKFWNSRAHKNAHADKLLKYGNRASHCKFDFFRADGPWPEFHQVGWAGKKRQTEINANGDTTSRRKPRPIRRVNARNIMQITNLLRKLAHKLAMPEVPEGFRTLELGYEVLALYNKKQGTVKFIDIHGQQDVKWKVDETKTVTEAMTAWQAVQVWRPGKAETKPVIGHNRMFRSSVIGQVAVKDGVSVKREQTGVELEGK